MKLRTIAALIAAASLMTGCAPGQHMSTRPGTATNENTALHAVGCSAMHIFARCTMPQARGAA